MTYWKLLRRKAATVVSLSGGAKIMLAAALMLFPVVSILLHLRGLQFTQKALQAIPHWFFRRILGSDIERVRLTMWAVKTAERYSRLWSNCLKKSLVLWALLRAQNINSSLRIGVQRDAGTFKAHAWIEYGGIVLNDESDVALAFVPFQHSFEVST